MADWAGIDDDTVSSSCVRFPVSTLGVSPESQVGGVVTRLECQSDMQLTRGLDRFCTTA